MTRASGDDRPGGDYNLLPYTSMPIAYTQPARLAAMAMLHGLSPPEVATARVLEIGCASAGNLIPLATRFPDGHFTGIDLSAHHIDIGARRIAALGLSNITLRQGDIAQFDMAGERFDYIICHGVFSWVPRPAQDAIFQVCGSLLSDSGVAAISYNVLPGWHTRAIIRDVCLRLVSAEAEPRARVARVRELLAVLAESARSDTPYGLTLRSEAARLTTRPASYILGEFLAEYNDPLHFEEFAARAAQCALHYVCEADLYSSKPEHFIPAAAESIKRLAGEDRAKIEKFTDAFSGRTFRRSLLVKADAAQGKQRAPAPEQIMGLHCAARLRLDDAASSAGTAVFRDHTGKVFKVEDAIVRRTLVRLGQIYPSTATVADLADNCGPANSSRRNAIEATIAKTLLMLAAAGRASVSSAPLIIGRADDDRPRAWSVARIDAGGDQPWVSSLNHTSVLLNSALKLLLRHMTGENDRRQLASFMAQAAAEGRLALSDVRAVLKSDKAELTPTDLEAFVERAVAYCAANALLIA